MEADVAIRILLCLAGYGGEAQTRTIQREQRLYTFQLHTGLRLLERAGFVQTNGEKCVLCREPETVSLYDVVRAAQGEIDVTQCLGEGEFCPWEAQKICVVRGVMQPLQQKLVGTLREWTIARLSRQEKSLLEDCIASVQTE